MVIGAGKVGGIPDGLADPAKFDVRKAGGPDPENVSPLARSAALSIIDGAGLGQVGLVEGMGDPRLAYNLPPPSFPAPSAPAQQSAGAAGGSDAAGTTKATTGSGKTYADKAALLRSIISAGIDGGKGLALDDIRDKDLEDANGKKLSLEAIAQKIIERKRQEAEPPPAEPPADASSPTEQQSAQPPRPRVDAPLTYVA